MRLVVILLAVLAGSPLFAYGLKNLGKDIVREAAKEAKESVVGNLEVGSGVQVEWHGSWYPAHILKTQGDRYYIHYDGYSDSWNEWVGPSRIRH